MTKYGPYDIPRVKPIDRCLRTQTTSSSGVELLPYSTCDFYPN